jgi:hypothetical protein
MLIVGVGAFFLSMLWRYLLKKKEEGSKKEKTDNHLSHFTRSWGVFGIY